MGSAARSTGSGATVRFQVSSSPPHNNNTKSLSPLKQVSPGQERGREEPEDTVMDKSLSEALPALPAGLKNISPYVQRAEELREKDPIMAYWCAWLTTEMLC